MKTAALLLTLALSAAAPAQHGPRADFGVEPAQREAAEYLSASAAGRPDAASFHTDAAGAWLDIARVSHEHEDFQRAIHGFSAALAAEPESPSARVGLAYALAGRHRFSEALGHARAAAELRPDSLEVLALLADLHIALGHELEAEVLVEYLEARSLTLETLARRGLVHDLRGRREEALTSLRESLVAGGLLVS